MAYREDLVEKIRAVLGAQNDVEEKKMFGSLCFMVNGKMFVCIKNHYMFRVGPKNLDRALALPGVSQMQHGDRVMKGFVYVEPAVITSDKDLEFWLELCWQYNAIVPAKK